MENQEEHRTGVTGSLITGTHTEKARTRRKLDCKEILSLLGTAYKDDYSNNKNNDHNFGKPQTSYHEL